MRKDASAFGDMRNAAAAAFVLSVEHRMGRVSCAATHDKNRKKGLRAHVRKYRQIKHANALRKSGCLHAVGVCVCVGGGGGCPGEIRGNISVFSTPPTRVYFSA